MKYLRFGTITCILLLVNSTLAISQDLIVTNNGDSIHCKITKEQDDYLYFTFKQDNEFRNTLIARSDVKHYQVNYFQDRYIPDDQINKVYNPQFKFVFDAGYSYRTNKISENVPADFEDYAKKLKSGYHLGGNMTFYFVEHLGFGVKYDLFRSSNDMYNIYVEDEQGNRRYGNMEDDIKIYFVGPMFSTRLLHNSKRNALVINLSLGYLGYRNDAVLVDQNLIKGSTLGWIYDLGYDFGLNEYLSLGFQISHRSGTIVTITRNDGQSTETIELEEGEYIGLNRLDLSVGLRIHLDI